MTKDKCLTDQDQGRDVTTCAVTSARPVSLFMCTLLTCCDNVSRVIDACTCFVVISDWNSPVTVVLYVRQQLKMDPNRKLLLTKQLVCATRRVVSMTCSTYSVVW